MQFQAKMVTDSAITVIVDGKPYSMSVNHPNYKLALDAYKNDNAHDFISLINEKKGVEVYVAKDTTGNPTGIEIKDDTVYYKGRVLHNVIVDRILGLKNKGLPVDDMVLFLENMMKNPSATSVKELYDFLQNKSLPITKNGTFIGYKAVRSDYWSKTAGKTVLTKGKVDNEGRIYNGIGEEIECERNEVDDDRRNECSNGLHVGGLDYATVTFRSGNDKVVLVEVNPKDVVSVPQDYNAQKLRACAYKVISEYTAPLDDYSTTEVEDEYENYDYDEYEDYVDPKDLSVGDDIVFYYDDEVRYCLVDNVYGDSILGILDSSDPSYNDDYGVENQYRKFLFNKMSEVEVY